MKTEENNKKEIIYDNRIYKQIFNDNPNYYISNIGKPISIVGNKIKEIAIQKNFSNVDYFIIRHNGENKTLMLKRTIREIFGISENIMKKYEDYIDIKGFEGLYKINRNGNIIAMPNKTHTDIIELKLCNVTGGYKAINLVKNKKQKTYLVHRLVAEHFIPNPNNYNIVNHKDENKTNNNADNLEWCTDAYNNKYSKGHSVFAFNKDTNEMLKFKSLREAGMYFKISPTTIKKYRNLKKKYMNYRFL